jgi:hypothetical protein
MSKSIKMLQSEAGVVGEASPNIQFAEDVARKLGAEFDHTHGTITNDDCVIFIANTALGRSYIGDKICLNHVVSLKGCQSALARALYRAAKESDNFFEAMLMACEQMLREGGDGE